MTFVPSPLPDYMPHFAAPSVAAQLRTARDRYQQQIDAIDAEVAAAEQAFAEAFVAYDANQNTRERIAALTRTQRRIV